jgi:hypothetical protein
MKQDAINYCQVVCQCPHGHLLGTIMQTQSGIFWCADRPLSNNKDRIDGELIEGGKKVCADCSGCGNVGRYGTNYQASWARVAAKISEARDTRAERVVLTFG